MSNFLFVLTSSDYEKATRCFQLVKVAHSKGHFVRLFLVDGGVDWSIKDTDGSVKTLTGDCVDDYLPFITQAGIAVGVCTPCAKNRELPAEQFHTNMRLDTAMSLIDAAAESTVMTF
jgi:tRNA 2-thiouridine synthesizing protein D